MIAWFYNEWDSDRVSVQVLNLYFEIQKEFRVRPHQTGAINWQFILVWYLRLSQACNKPGQSFNSAWMQWLGGLPVCLPTWIPAHTLPLHPLHMTGVTSTNQADLLLKPVSQSHVLWDCLWEGGDFSWILSKSMLFHLVYQVGLAYPTLKGHSTHFHINLYWKSVIFVV